MFRESQGDTQINISYICAFSSLAPFGEEIIQKTRAGHPKGCWHNNSIRAESDINIATKNALNKMRLEINHSITHKSIYGLPETLITDDAILDKLRNLDNGVVSKQLNDLKITDFRPNVFLTFTMQGKEKEINELLAGKQYIILANRILTITDGNGLELSSALQSKKNFSNR